MQLFKNIQAEIISQIRKSNESLKIAVTWFTNHEIFNAIIEKLQLPNYQVEVIVLNDSVNNKIEGVEFQKIVDLNGKFYYSNVENMVHHKFCIFDNKIVMTGSYNWTYYAENRNWENVVTIDDFNIVNAYIEEFKKIISSHEQVFKVAEKSKNYSSMSTNDYLQSDYLFQAKSEKNRGNDINLAKIYTEMLKLNGNQETISNERNEILNKHNSNQFEFCPFDIGIKYTHGYQRAIPILTKLPYINRLSGSTTLDNQEAVQIIIQKHGLEIKTLAEFSFCGLKPDKAGAANIEINVSLVNSGLLAISCNEIGGNEAKIMQKYNIKNWL